MPGLWLVTTGCFHGFRFYRLGDPDSSADGQVAIVMAPIYILITSSEIRMLGELLETQAPQTTQRFLDLLPAKFPLIHVRWSGEAVWIPESHLGDCSSLGYENHTSHPAPGHMIWYPGGYSETEILLAYGGCSFSSKMGQLAGNHFLSIVKGGEQLAELGRSILWDGHQNISFEVATAEE